MPKRVWLPQSRMPLLAGAIGVCTLALLACQDDRTLRPRERAPAGARQVLDGGDGGGVAFVNAGANGRCLDVAGASRAPGAALTTWACTGAPQERFTWTEGGELRVYDGTADVLCVTVAEPTVAAGGALVVARCDDQRPRRWEPAPGGSGIRLAGTELCLAVPARGEEGDGTVLAACAPEDLAQQWRQGASATTRMAALAPLSADAGCGASATITTYEVDSLATPYAIPPLSETVTVCQTWVGGDYQTRFVTVESNDDADPLTIGDVRTATYGSGQASGFLPDGSAIGAPASTGGTLFDFLYADAAVRQASYDDPYYALRGGSSGCADPTQIVCDQAMSAQSGGDEKFKAHGLRRRGVRALVDAAKEIAPGGDGSRRFRRATADGEETISIATGTELLVGEEVVAPGRRTTTRHSWRREKRGWVRERTEVEAVETVAGRQVRSRAVLTYSNVRVE